MSHRLAHTMIALAFDERQPEMMSCASNSGKVYSRAASSSTVI